MEDTHQEEVDTYDRVIPGPALGTYTLTINQEVEERKAVNQKVGSR